MKKPEVNPAILYAFQGLEEKRNRAFALVSAVRNNLSREDISFNEIRLLDMAEELLGDIREEQILKKILGVEL